MRFKLYKGIDARRLARAIAAAKGLRSYRKYQTRIETERYYAKFALACPSVYNNYIRSSRGQRMQRHINAS